jgi:hypothetical protein
VRFAPIMAHAACAACAATCAERCDTAFARAPRIGVANYGCSAAATRSTPRSSSRTPTTCTPTGSSPAPT